VLQANNEPSKSSERKYSCGSNYREYPRKNPEKSHQICDKGESGDRGEGTFKCLTMAVQKWRGCNKNGRQKVADGWQQQLPVWHEQWCGAATRREKDNGTLEDSCSINTTHRKMEFSESARSGNSTAEKHKSP
jgi:hypothetical protein